MCFVLVVLSMHAVQVTVKKIFINNRKILTFAHWELHVRDVMLIWSTGQQQSLAESDVIQN